MWLDRSLQLKTTHPQTYTEVGCQQATSNRDGRAQWQIEMPADDKVEMDWLPCPCHVAPSAPKRGKDRWIPWQKAGLFKKDRSEQMANDIGME